eukprot:CAMPEP_0195648760 /NCGR_PEP_ID=MMETSP0815-20121206/30817_1 /TAXON_ID=97485 /ORGANISM="Prymnesium parvum, Strain Texoma1" /LENGTH=194 /DNA_ID=CAMNT_0040792443 /DNA_START=445 /DNA_END=1029 /DNA_ORIENTATION=-
MLPREYRQLKLANADAFRTESASRQNACSPFGILQDPKLRFMGVAQLSHILHDELTLPDVFKRSQAPSHSLIHAVHFELARYAALHLPQLGRSAATHVVAFNAHSVRGARVQPVAAATTRRSLQKLRRRDRMPWNAVAKVHHRRRKCVVDSIAPTDGHRLDAIAQIVTIQLYQASHIRNSLLGWKLWPLRQSPC